MTKNWLVQQTILVSNCIEDDSVKVSFCFQDLEKTLQHFVTAVTSKFIKPLHLSKQWGYNVYLNDGAGGQQGSCTLIIVSQRVAQPGDGLLVVTVTQVQQP